VVARAGVHLLFLQAQLGGQQKQQVFRHGAVIDKAHGAATQAVLQAFFHLFDQAFGNIIVEAQFGVAHHLEGVCRDVVVIEHEKNVVQAQANDVIHKDDVVAAGGRRHFHKPGAGGVDRNAQHRIPAFSRCGGGFHFDGMIYLAVLKKGQFCGFVQNKRHQLRVNHAAEILAAKGILPLAQLGFVTHANALVLHGVQHFFIGFTKGRLCRSRFQVNALQGLVGCKAAHEQRFFLAP